MKAVLIAIATGGYLRYEPRLTTSASRWFLSGLNPHFIIIRQPDLGFPLTTLCRYHLLLEQAEHLKHFDYIFHIDIDMEFVASVGPEILGERVATLHPAYAHGKRPYYAGAFNGGKSDQFLQMAEWIRNRVNADARNHYIAKWHDETHLNAYYESNPPTTALSPSYCYPQTDVQLYRDVWRRDYTPRIIALTKPNAADRC